ncbi:MAG: prepilin-type N-terminal cleavage/methylation domain-containing protein [Acidovorax sp.]|nr:prepilin-type N-terminal cleavage/methylation domain-containing protein [Acidovorax sp.]
MQKSTPIAGTHCSQQRSRQCGATLIELMVGITIGLLTVAVGLGAVVMSRGISGTVSEASQMQQQAAYAFRVIGQQIRQAGSIRQEVLSTPTAPASGSSETVDNSWLKYTFENPARVFNRNTQSVVGSDSTASSDYKLTLGYQNYLEPVGPASAASDKSPFRDCLGQNPNVDIVRSRFQLVGDELRCAGESGSPQPVIKGVADFVVTYVSQATTFSMNPTISYAASAASVPDWNKIYGIEVCLELIGTEYIDTVGSSYRNCQGNLASRGNRLHMVFRNTYQIRSQGT